MRICFLCQEDIVTPQGGTGTYVRNISMALAARGHDVHIISRRQADLPSAERVAGVQVHRVDAPGPPVLYSPLYFAQSRHAFAALHQAAPFDLIHGNLPLMSSWGVRGHDLPPVVETVHCTVDEELKALAATPLGHLNPSEKLTRLLAPVIRRRERTLLHRATGIIAVSAGLQRELGRQYDYPAAGVAVIPNGIDYARFAHPPAATRAHVRHALGIGPDVPVILYLGRLMERKRVIDLIYALPRILAVLPEAHLVIVGKQNAQAARLRETAQQWGLAGHITMVDHVPYTEVPAYYAMADVYALPSAYEGFPFTVLEAMATGTPVVASAIPGINEQIVSNQTGLLHPVGDVPGIAQQLLRILSDPHLAQRLRTNAQWTVARRFDWTAIGGQTETVLTAAAYPPRGGPITRPLDPVMLRQSNTGGRF